MRRILIALGLALGLLSTVVPSTDAATPASGHARQVRVYDYDLGDSAFTVSGFHAFDRHGMPSKRLAPIELIGRVYAPAHSAGERLPLVVMAHGLFWTCADDATAEVSGDWPCRGGLTGIHSERGYDYLGRTLAARGMVVVSISANGVNAGELGEVADKARGVLVYQHLRMWRSLVRDGNGPLQGAFTDARTGRPAAPDFRRSVDLHDVGLLGHSRGGRGMMWAAADKHRHRVPDGVRFRAVFGLAAAEPPFLDGRARRVQVSQIPLMSWIGGCDATGDDSYNRLAQRGGDPVNIAITVHGANHNNLNSRWSAHSGLPGGEDDAAHPTGRPGRCFDGFDDSNLQKTLGYRAEQRVASTYVKAFFARYLQGDHRYDTVLAGTRKPMRDVTEVDVQQFAPAGR
ncbi:hypothetical protein ABLE68_18165 [Nocardioides sp. CN2-186]|uniref:hypothetical protein n=1 Tax=Nocardioides tweenelious TaxID=3156607 RepID=UPI0032B3976A